MEHTYSPERPFEPEREKVELNLEGNEWTVPNDRSYLSEMRKALEVRMAEAGWVEQQIEELKIAVDEAVVNAMEHGNIGIKRNEGENEIDYKARVEEYKQKPEYKNKAVQVSVDISPERAVIKVRDQGDGYPQEMIDLAALPLAEIMKSRQRGGRGIYVMKHETDSLEISGNTVTLIKENSEKI